MNPKARTEGISRAQSGESSFLYDARTGKYHELNTTAGRVFDLCDGSRTVSDIAAALPDEIGPEREALVLASLAQLDRAGLTEAATPGAAAYSRRRFAAAIAAPIVMSVVAPTPVSAQSGGDPGDGDGGNNVDGPSSPAFGGDTGAVDGDGSVDAGGNSVDGGTNSVDGSGLDGDLGT